MALTPAGVDFLRDHIEDHTYQLQWWPKYQRGLLLESHLKYAGRFQLTIFLLGNRLNPVTIASWYLGRNMLKDQAAKKHVAELIRGHMDGKLTKYDVYVMNATLANGDPPSMFEFRDGDKIARGEKQPLVTPSFAYENLATTGVPNDWDHAIQLLTLGAPFPAVHVA
jgi:hypothetical protein